MMGWNIIYHWIREWSAPVHQTMWIELQTIATVFAFGAAFCYVVLTSRLLHQATAHRETDLMLRLIDEYDGLRADMRVLEHYFDNCAANGPMDPVVRFRDSFEPLGCTQWIVDDSRFKVSRFFVKVRKLSAAGFLDRRLIVAALSRSAIEDVFLGMVDPLDQVISRMTYGRDNVTDRNFYAKLALEYPRPVKLPTSSD